MIAVNGKPLNTEDKTNAFFKHYNKCVQAIKEMAKQDTIVLKYTENRIKPADPTDPYGRPSSPTGFDVPMSENFTLEGTTYKINYYTNIITSTKGDSYKPKYTTFPGQMKLNITRDMELAFFLLFVSTWVAPIPGISTKVTSLYADLQNPQRRPLPWFKLDDKVQAAKDIVEIEKLIAKINTVIMDDEFGLKDKELQGVAYAYEIMDSALEPSELRLRIKQKLLTTINGKYDMIKITEFLQTYQNKDRMEMLGNVKYAEKQGIISVEQKGKKRQWFLNLEEGSPMYLCEAPYNTDVQAILAEYLLTDGEEEKAELLKERVKQVK